MQATDDVDKFWHLTSIDETVDDIVFGMKGMVTVFLFRSAKNVLPKNRSRRTGLWCRFRPSYHVYSTQPDARPRTSREVTAANRCAEEQAVGAKKLLEVE